MTAPHGNIYTVHYVLIHVVLGSFVKARPTALILCKRLALLRVLVALLFVFVSVLGNLWCSLRQ